MGGQFITGEKYLCPLEELHFKKNVEKHWNNVGDESRDVIFVLHMKLGILICTVLSFLSWDICLHVVPVFAVQHHESVACIHIFSLPGGSDSKESTLQCGRPV